MLNRALIIGNLGDDPKITTTPNGDKVANLSIATTERWKDQNGNKQERTEWHRVTVWNQGIVKVIEQYVKKGSKVYIEGQLQTRKWQDQNGQDRYTTEIVLKPYRGQIELLDSKHGNDNGGSTSQSYDKSGGDYGAASGGSSAYGGTSTSHQRPIDDDSDSVPF